MKKDKEAGKRLKGGSFRLKKEKKNEGDRPPFKIRQKKVYILSNR